MLGGYKKTGTHWVIIEICGGWLGIDVKGRTETVLRDNRGKSPRAKAVTFSVQLGAP